jgi:hypothetical protein
MSKNSQWNGTSAGSVLQAVQTPLPTVDNGDEQLLHRAKKSTIDILVIHLEKTGSLVRYFIRVTPSPIFSLY